MSFFLAGAISLMAAVGQGPVDLGQAAIVVEHGGDATPIAATVLSEEVRKRTGLAWPVQTAWPEGAAIVVLDKPAENFLDKPVPPQMRTLKPEGYGVEVTSLDGRPVVWIVGADKRGALYGVGKFLRTLKWGQNSAHMDSLSIVTSPAYAIRGHQLGYRATANTYDAWTMEQYEQYIRDLALFGANSIENIPFQDERQSPVMKMPRREMNIAISKMCAKYDIDYWVWIPAVFDLSDKEKLAEHFADYERFLGYTERLDNIFFPGGDPGDNPASLVMPYLDDLSKLVAKYHPKAKIWVSLQGFEKSDVDDFYNWVNAHMPDWMGGVVFGPSSPPMAETRVRLPKKYPIRNYPDITHIVRCEYPVPWLDQAYAFTIGREPVNPRPAFYANTHNLYAPYTVGFLSYSDGSHDDVNKAVWSAMAWDPSADLRQVMVEYCNLYLNSESAAEMADAIFALEKNLEGPLATNGSVDNTLTMWRSLEPKMGDNWRWQMLTLRAYFDFYVRHRLIFEQGLEKEVNAVLAASTPEQAGASIDAALAILKRADEPPSWQAHGVNGKDVRDKIVDLCERLWQDIGFQTSVAKYNASGEERGAVLDFVDYPLNNRRWLEDELAKVRALPQAEQAARMREIGTWENPEGVVYYDYVGEVAKSKHIVRGEEANTDPDIERHPLPDWMWWEDGKTRVRQSWIGFMNWPIAMRYEGLDPDSDYVIRVTGYNECLLRADGQRLTPTIYGKKIGEIKEFPVPRELYKDAVLVLTFDRPDEHGLNWREQSRLNEVWVVKR
jgi:hypothetical protein